MDAMILINHGCYCAYIKVNQNTTVERIVKAFYKRTGLLINNLTDALGVVPLRKELPLWKQVPSNKWSIDVPLQLHVV